MSLCLRMCGETPLGGCVHTCATLCHWRGVKARKLPISSSQSVSQSSVTGYEEGKLIYAILRHFGYIIYTVLRVCAEILLNYSMPLLNTIVYNRNMSLIDRQN